MSLAAAEKKIRFAHCRVGVVRRRASTLLHENHVLHQKPAWGRRKPAGARVVLVVGKGPKTGRLPRLGAVLSSQLPPFIAYDPPAGGIWLVKPDGSDAHQVGPPDATDPVWSPDATQILYQAPAPQNDQGVTADLYVMNAEGADQHPIMPSAGIVHDPTWGDECCWMDYDFHWSPDGKQIIFTNLVQGFTGVEIANADGSSERMVPNTWTGSSASLSPDASYLTFEVYPEHIVSAASGWGIYVVKPDGTGLRQITFGGGVGEPSWSPDGTRITYGCLGTFDLARGAHGVCELSGKPARQRILYMTRSQSLFFHPTWNANGTKILVTIEQGENGPEQIGLMPPSGGPPVKTGILIASGTYPDW
jgi:hypothetical protein